MPDDLSGNTSKKDMFYSYATVRTYNNEVYLLLPCELDYLLMFPTIFGNDLKSNPILYLFYSEFWEKSVQKSIFLYLGNSIISSPRYIIRLKSDL